MSEIGHNVIGGGKMSRGRPTTIRIKETSRKEYALVRKKKGTKKDYIIARRKSRKAAQNLKDTLETREWAKKH